MHFSPLELKKLTQASDFLVEANRPLKVLKAVSWSPGVSKSFFAQGAKNLPVVEYTSVDVQDVFKQIEAAKRLIDGDSPVHAWLNRVAKKTAETAHMLSALGTQQFFEHSKNLFGTPTCFLRDDKNTTLALAQQLDKTLSRFNECDLFECKKDRTYSAAEIKNQMEPLIKTHFGNEAPEIIISEDVSAKAIAAVKHIKLRASAPFTDLDAQQLLMHEAHIHIATSLNGRAQSKFKILGTSHAGTTKTQEGLAVFSEIISGVIDPVRMQRLADRVLAINMSIEGADFLDIYNFYLTRSPNKYEAFENSRRIVRGGLVTGGAPFTKDGVYLEGLIRVHNFLQTTLPSGDTRFLNILFCGKLDLDDVGALMMLEEQKLLTIPKFRPPWAQDMRFLASLLAYSQFLNQMDFGQIQETYSHLAVVPD